jgi:hypothetical protein
MLAKSLVLLHSKVALTAIGLTVALGTGAVAAAVATSVGAGVEQCNKCSNNSGDNA